MAQTTLHTGLKAAFVSLSFLCTSMLFVYFLKKPNRHRITVMIVIKMIVITTVYNQPLDSWVKGSATFCPKKPETIVGTVRTIDDTVSSFIVQFKLAFATLSKALATLFVTSCDSFPVSNACCNST